MIRFFRLFCLVGGFISLIAFTSCNQDPTSAGSNIISDKDKIGFSIIDSYESNLVQRSSYAQEVCYNGASEYVLLGKVPYAESSALYHWTLDLNDSLFTQFTNGALKIKSAWIQMKPRYTLGSTSANFDFSVHQIRSPWSSTYFIRDSIASLRYDAADVKSGITIDSLVKFHLNTSVIKEWFKYQADTTTTPKNYGLIFKPKASTQKMYGFYSSDVTLDTSDVLLDLVLENPSTGYIDTVLISPTYDTHVITKSTLPVSSSTDLFLEGSLALRGKLYFDISSVPRNSIISNATLELTVDDSQTLDGSNTSDSVAVQTLADSTSFTLSKDSSYQVILVKSGNKYSGNIGWMIQKWIRSDLYYTNQGLYLYLADEIKSAARIAFYGSKDSNKERRPRLKITYMQKQ